MHDVRPQEDQVSRFLLMDDDHLLAVRERGIQVQEPLRLVLADIVADPFLDLCA